jgi:hypothetical protein
VVDLNNQVLQIRNELEESQKEFSKLTLNEKTLKEELDRSKTQYLDMQRAERTVRIDLEMVKRNVICFLVLNNFAWSQFLTNNCNLK